MSRRARAFGMSGAAFGVWALFDVKDNEEKARKVRGMDVLSSFSNLSSHAWHKSQL